MGRELCVGLELSDPIIPETTKLAASIQKKIPQTARYPLSPTVTKPVTLSTRPGGWRGQRSAARGLVIPTGRRSRTKYVSFAVNGGLRNKFHCRRGCESCMVFSFAQRNRNNAERAAGGGLPLGKYGFHRGWRRFLFAPPRLRRVTKWGKG